MIPWSRLRTVRREEKNENHITHALTNKAGGGVPGTGIPAAEGRRKKPEKA
jgi:hypothetical protein